jgi:hypothetical protein
MEQGICEEAHLLVFHHIVLGWFFFLSIDHQRSSSSSRPTVYLNLNHVTSVFFLSIDHQRSSSSLQYPVHSHISINHVSLLSQSALPFEDLIISEFISWITNLIKQTELYTNLNYNIY